MQLSIQQTQELINIIDKNQLAILGQELGADFLTETDKTILRSYGIDPDTLYRPELSSIDTSFHFGMLAEALGVMQAKTVTYPEIRQYVKEGRYLPVGEIQREAVKSIKMQTFNSLKALGTNIFTDVNQILVDKTRAGQQAFLAQELKEGIDKGLSVSQIAHEIATKTGDWNRNFDRIIETASQTAFETGKAAEIQRKNPNSDPLVGKYVMAEACKHCIRLYLTNGAGSAPKLFKLSELIANGSNIGRKVADWLPTIDAIHPHCRCRLFEYTEGFLWDTKEQTFSIPDPAYQKQIAASRQLFEVKIGDKIHYL